nr:MAG: putative capsid protein [Arizlama virus]
MPLKKTYKKRTYRKRKSAPRRRVARKRSTNVAEYASLSERRTFLAPGGNQINTLYSLMTTSLNTFTRAPLVAQGYMNYRIKNINISIKSPYDSFVPTGTTYNKPYLYHMIDKSGAIPTNVTLEGMKQMGAKPRALDEGKRTISWKPSVLTHVRDSPSTTLPGQAAQYKLSPWLSTNSSTEVASWAPSTVEHLGVYWMVEASAQGSPPPFFYEVDVEVQFEFKGPLVARATGMVNAVELRPATLNDSPDGIVGGPDGY